MTDRNEACWLRFVVTVSIKEIGFFELNEEMLRVCQQSQHYNALLVWL